ncbi:MAG TPA: YggS family pyridoxal phosphate-dependent enzyme [Steroidobacteraceae bacterium]|jgi:pyridoxal phosphate enzyme (YggS family)|nr:YggS family pyridoxal phosphate-dependent enzyme [Steroidobacteraceae bacterium]
MLIAPHNSAADTLISGNLQQLRAQVAEAAGAARRTVESITVIAVSKGHEASSVRAAAVSGVLHFGESYLQEATRKLESLRDLQASWHFIGRLQANKSRSVAESFDWVHGIDRLKIAQRLSAQRPHYAPALQVCLQVNIAGESGKAGVAPERVSELARAVALLPRLQLRGLMCILPAQLSSADNRRHFGALRRLQEQLNAQGAGLDTLSMGMSADFRDAILEGATLIRVGTAIFGPRTASSDE